MRLDVPMDSSQSPPPNDRRHQGELVPLVPKVWPPAEDARSGRPARGADAGRDLADGFIGTPWGGSDFSAGLRAVEPAIDVPPRSADFENDEFASDRPSIGRRAYRALARFSIAALIGVGATFAWQSQGDDAKEMVRTWVPPLSWLSSVSTTTSPPDVDVAAVQTRPIPAGQRSAQDAALPQPASATPTVTAPAAAATSPASAPQLEAMARDLAVVRRSVEQLAAKQEQMAHDIAILQMVEQDIREKMSSPPQSRSVRARLAKMRQGLPLHPPRSHRRCSHRLCSHRRCSHRRRCHRRCSHPRCSHRQRLSRPLPDHLCPCPERRTLGARKSDPMRPPSTSAESDHGFELGLIDFLVVEADAEISLYRRATSVITNKVADRGQSANRLQLRG